MGALEETARAMTAFVVAWRSSLKKEQRQQVKQWLHRGRDETGSEDER